MTLAWLTWFVLVQSAAPSAGPPPAPGPAPASTAKQAEAVRTPAPPVIDGRLDDRAWSAAPWFSDFVQKEPVEGSPPDERTEVAFLYDEEALYVGARLYSLVPSRIPGPVTRRDQFSNAEHFIVILDTYHDRRTGYSFFVTSAGVRGDYYHPSDSEGHRDFGFDPVWEARAARDSLGWTAEMRIPFSQLRFNRAEEQVWGLNINRWMPGRNEDVYWVVIPRNETGFFSRFGILRGIRGIRPSRRLELLPYVAGDARYTSGLPSGDPFHDGSAYRGRAGLDLKLGLGPHLTLDAAINPDFGQVEADPAEVNLTAFETFFAERRPFFLEGATLLQGNGPGYYYSRRIGAPPRGLPAGDYLDIPDHSTILGAAKVTGRLGSGLSLGALAALTDRETARTFDTTAGRLGRAAAAPRTGYGVVRAQQEFGPDASTAGFILTAVERDLDRGSPLAARYNRRAWSGGGDWVLRWRGGAYQLSGWAGLSHVEGDAAAILALQTASQRYYQRPDQDYVRVDSNRTSLTGYTGGLRFAKNSGAHWLYGFGAAFETPGLELNDLGRLGAADDIDLFGNLRYRETRPGRVFHRWSLGVFGNAGWNFGGTHTSSDLGLNANATWKDFSGSFVELSYAPSTLSDNLTRGGPLMRRPSSVSGGLGYFSPEAHDTRFTLEAGAARDAAGGWDLSASGSLELRPAAPVAISFSPRLSRGLGSRQYIGTYPGGSARTFGGRYVFGFVDRTTVSAQLRASYAVTPALTLEGYLEPFAASGRYARIGELAAAGSGTIRRYGTGGTTLGRRPGGDYLVTDQGGRDTVLIANPDFHVLSFRSNLVLRWEWRRGSTAYLVWQQNRGRSTTSPRRARLDDLWESAGADGDNVIAVKLNYWLGVR
ncbi:MAG TPA: DUF5916 domain-containing protein [Gemmatimonadales bacterium]|jgi:hypothetical protein|nr:DUF5916 domain-containing protein [Gemmatimonadales bacterium]